MDPFWSPNCFHSATLSTPSNHWRQWSSPDDRSATRTHCLQLLCKQEHFLIPAQLFPLRLEPFCCSCKHRYHISEMPQDLHFPAHTRLNFPTEINIPKPNCFKSLWCYTAFKKPNSVTSVGMLIISVALDNSISRQRKLYIIYTFKALLWRRKFWVLETRDRLYTANPAKPVIFFCLFAARMMKAFKTFRVTQHQQSFLTQITMLLLNSQHLPQNSSTTFLIPDYTKTMKKTCKCTFLAALNILILTPLYKLSGILACISTWKLLSFSFNNYYHKHSFVTEIKA